MVLGAPSNTLITSAARALTWLRESDSTNRITSTSPGLQSRQTSRFGVLLPIKASVAPTESAIPTQREQRTTLLSPQLRATTLNTSIQLTLEAAVPTTRKPCWWTQLAMFTSPALRVLPTL